MSLVRYLVGFHDHDAVDAVVAVVAVVEDILTYLQGMFQFRYYGLLLNHCL